MQTSEKLTTSAFSVRDATEGMTRDQLVAAITYYFGYTTALYDSNKSRDLLQRAIEIAGPIEKESPCSSDST